MTISGYIHSKISICYVWMYLGCLILVSGLVFGVGTCICVSGLVFSVLYTCRVSVDLQDVCILVGCDYGVRAPPSGLCELLEDATSLRRQVLEVNLACLSYWAALLKIFVDLHEFGFPLKQICYYINVPHQQYTQVATIFNYMFQFGLPATCL